VTAASSSRRVICGECERTVTLNNSADHVRRWHPNRLGTPRRDIFRELDGSPLGPTGSKPKPKRKPKPTTVGTALAALPASPTSTELPPLDVEDVDQIVLGLVDQLAGPAAMFPVEHLPALLAWRTATETFLRSVTRSSG